MTIKAFTFNPFMTNCYICHDSGEAVLIDASSHQASEHQEIIRYVEEEGLEVKHLLLTHAHIDHIFGCVAMSKRFGMKFKMHQADRELLERSRQQATMFGVRLKATPEISNYLAEGDEVHVGSVTLEVLHTPGHSPGSITFVDRADDAAFSGDVLFRNSVGRIEGLPQTSKADLFSSIENKLLPLGDDMRVLPGHGPETTVGRERRHNPFLQ